MSNRKWGKGEKEREKADHPNERELSRKKK